MRTFDFTPYYRSTVGFDQLFDLLDKSIRSDWPPYNIEKKGEDQYRITMTVAGFAPNEIELVQHGGTLLVTGQKGEQPELLHQGIPLSFKQSFNLADHVKVVGAECGARSAHDRPRARGAGAAEAATHRDRRRRRDEGCEAGQSAEADRHKRQEGRVTCERTLRSASRSRPGGPDCGEWR